MRRDITISFALLMILFSTAIPGVYALEEEGDMEMPGMDAEQMKEMTLGMITNSIDTLTTLQSELEDEDLLDSVDSLLGQMEEMSTELEATDDEDEITGIIEEFRSSMDEAPDEIRVALMQNGPGREGQEPMDGNRTMMEGDENMQPPEGEFPGNGTMDGEGPMTGEAPADRPDDDATSSDGSSSDSTSEGSEESTGFLSSLINAIRSLF
ncbi:hypothetical protein [Methanolobus sp. WCC4]|uniref:hypothetical protein n=1 Tax=Methanolobus sp. WCC4 TaxID=3125784 RepID=UPI0030FB883D